jgi:hypothetical protein
MFTRLTEHGFTHQPTPGYLASDLDAVMPGPHLVSEVCPSLRIVAEWENDSREERPLWGSIESSLRSIALKR